MSRKILVLPGDGIGPEITAEAVKVLDACRVQGPRCDPRGGAVGGAGYEAHGEPLPAATLDKARAADAILFGAVGGPKWDALEDIAKRPEQGLLGLRKELGLFANFRPAILYPQLAEASSLKPEIVAGLDILIVRELTGGIYFGQPRGIEERDGQRVGFNTCVYSEAEIERIGRVAFEMAQQARQEAVQRRQGQRARGHHAVARGGQPPGTGIPGRRAVAHVCRQRRHAAGACTQAVRRDRHRQHVRRHPVRCGGDADRLDRHAALGVARRTGQGMYEPSHGSAPDIAGQGLANPLATILSVAMMLRYSLDENALALRIERAVGQVLDQGLRTADIAYRGHAAGEHRRDGRRRGDGL